LVATSFANFLRSIWIYEDLLVVNESEPVFCDVERGDINELHRKLDAGDVLNMSNSENGTLLMCAAWSQRPAAMKLLLDCGAAVHVSDIYGRTALHYAAKCHSLDCAKLLLSHGADPNVQDANGETPLISALKESGGRIPRLLVAVGADVNKRTHSGETALGVCQNARAREALLAAGAHG
jgi:ankyrin repeat protein